MPTVESVKQFLAGVVVPVLAGAGAAWLASKGVLNVFDISKATATTDLDELGVFVVVTAAGWLTSHHLLRGNYSPAAKLGIRGGSVGNVPIAPIAPVAAKRATSASKAAKGA